MANEQWTIEEAEPESWSVEEAEPEKWTIEDSDPEGWSIEEAEPAQQAPKKKVGVREFLGEVFNPKDQVIFAPSIPALTTIPRGVAERLPFAGALYKGQRYLGVYLAAKAAQDGTATDADYALLSQFGKEMEEESGKDHSWGYKVAEIVAELPAFATEIAATGGVFSAGKKAGIKAMEKVIVEGAEKAAKRGLAARTIAYAAPRAVGGVAQTAAMPQRIAATAMENVVSKNVAPRVQIAQQAAYETGEPLRQKLDESMDDMDADVFVQMAKAFPETAIEVGSERVGGLLGKLPLPARVKAIKAAIASRFSGSGRGTEILEKFKKATAWNDFGEIFEERVAEVGHYLAQKGGVEEDYGKESPAMVKFVTGEGGRAEALKEFIGQLAVEAAAFAIPGVTMKGAESYLNSGAGSPRKTFIRNLEEGLRLETLDPESLDHIVYLINHEQSGLRGTPEGERLLRIAMQRARGMGMRGPLVANIGLPNKEAKPAQSPSAPADQDAKAKSIRQQFGLPESQGVLPIEPTDNATASPLAPPPQPPKGKVDLAAGKPIDFGQAGSRVSRIPAATTPQSYEQAIQQPMPATVPTLPMYPAAPASQAQSAAPAPTPAAPDNALLPVQEPQVEPPAQPAPAPVLTAETVSAALTAKGIPVEGFERVMGIPLKEMAPNQYEAIMGRLETMGEPEIAALRQSLAPISTPAATPQSEPAAPAPKFMRGDKVKVTVKSGKKFTEKNAVLLSEKRDSAGKLSYEVRIGDAVQVVPATSVRAPSKANRAGFKYDPNKSLENAVKYVGGINPEMVEKEGLSGEWKAIPANRRKKISNRKGKKTIGEVAEELKALGYDVDGSNLLYLLADETAAKKGNGQSDSTETGSDYDLLMHEYEQLRKESDRLKEEKDRQAKEPPVQSEEELESLAQSQPPPEEEAEEPLPPPQKEEPKPAEPKKEKPKKLSMDEAKKKFAEEKAAKKAQKEAKPAEPKAEPEPPSPQEESPTPEVQAATERAEELDKQIKEESGLKSIEEYADANAQAEVDRRAEFVRSTVQKVIDGQGTWSEKRRALDIGAKQHKYDGSKWYPEIPISAKEIDALVKRELADTTSQTGLTPTSTEAPAPTPKKSGSLFDEGPKNVREPSARYGNIGRLMEDEGLTEVVLEGEAVQFNASDLSTPGGTNYREVFVTAPRGRILTAKSPEEAEANLGKPFWFDGHIAYGHIENPVVRLRVNDRVGPNGERILFLEEIQPPNKENQSKMPENIRKKWREIGMRWAVNHAMENGYDTVAWTNGRMQADRYSLRDKVEFVQHKTQEDGLHEVIVHLKDRSEPEYAILEQDELAGFIGKDLAQQVADGKGKPDSDGEYRWISGNDIEIGGEGLMRIYDQDLKSVAKKFGAKSVGSTRVGDRNLKVVERNWKFVALDGIRKAGTFDTREEAEAFVAAESKGKEVPAISIADFRDNLIDSEMAKVVSEPYERPTQTVREVVRSLETVWGQTGAVGQQVAGSPRKRGGVSLLGLRITPQILKGRWIDVRGEIVRGVEDIVAIGRLFRNPHFELFHAIYVVKGKVVAHEGISSRLPSVSSAFKDKPAKAVKRTRKRIARLAKKNGVLPSDVALVMLHNHPSGDASVSDADKDLTRFFSREFQGNIAGHVILDHSEYSFIDPSGRANENISLPNSIPDAWANPLVDHPGLGEGVNSSRQLANWGKWYAQPSENTVTVIYIQNREVQGIETAPVKLFMKKKEFMDLVRGRAREYGAKEFSAYYANPKSFDLSQMVLGQMRQYVGEDLMLDGHVEGMDVFGRPGIRETDPTEKMSNLGLTDEQVGKGTRRLREKEKPYNVTDSPAFRKWFGESKVVDADGKPMVVYHGTRSGEFAEFDPAKKGSNTFHKGDEVGFHFTTDNQDASVYAGQYAKPRNAWPEKSRIISAYVSIQNPLVLNSGTITKEDIARAKSEGRDGIIANAGAYGHKEIVAFSPTQIKSAIGNDGSFDPENPNILREKGRGYGSDSQEFDEWFAGSKAVDDNGSPVKVYRGTPESRDADFDAERGSYFSSKRDVAGGYTSRRGIWVSRPTGEVSESYLSLQNPLIIDALGKRNDNIPVPWQEWKPKVFGNLPAGAVNINEAYAKALEMGHDGLIVRNVVDTVDAESRTVSDVYVASSPSQIRPADPSLVREKGRGYGEDERDLIAVHNLSAENLLHSLKMGGIPVPSLAITKKDQAITGFGEITLVGSKDMVDPKGYANAKVYGADIYSPRYPSISYSISPKDSDKVLKRLEPSLREADPAKKFHNVSAYSLVEEIKDKGPRKAIRNSSEAYVAYLHETQGFVNSAEEYAPRPPYNDGDDPAFDEWLNGLLDELDLKPVERIFRGFTYAGNRRYIPHTLDRVVAILKKDLRGGEGFNYGVGSLRSKFTPQFKSVAQIKKEKGRLLSSEDFKRVKDEIDAEFFEIVKALTPLSPRGNDFGFADTVIAVMEDAPKMGVKRSLASYGMEDIPSDVENRIREFLGKLKHLPTEYFEAKILRGVDLSEFSGAVIPKKASKEVRDALASRGLQIAEYSTDDERQKAVESFAEKLDSEKPGVVFEPSRPYNEDDPTPKSTGPINTQSDFERRYAALVRKIEADKAYRRWGKLRDYISLPGDAAPKNPNRRPTLSWRSPNNVLQRMGGKHAEIANIVTEASRARKAAKLGKHFFGAQHFDDLANEIVKENGIKRGSQEDEMVRDLLDFDFTGLTPDKLRDSAAYTGDKEAAIRAADRLRNEVFDPIINHIRSNKELSDIIGTKGYIRGYFPHYFQTMKTKYGEKNAVQMMRLMLPKRFSSKFLEERQNKDWASGVSIFDVLPAYIHSTMKTVHDVPAYDRAKRIMETLPEGDGIERKYIEWYLNNYMGIKANPFGVEEFHDESRAIKLSRKVAQLYYDNLIGLNPKTWIINLTQPLTNTVPEVGMKYVLIGAKQLYGNKKARRQFHDSGLLMDYPGMEAGIMSEGAWRRLMHQGMSAAEYSNRGITYLAGLAKAKDMGLIGPAAEMYAMDLVDKTQFSYGPEAQSRILSAVTPDLRVFQTFKLKQTEFVRNLVADAWAEHKSSGGGSEARKKLGRFFALNVALPMILKLAGISLGKLALDNLGFTLSDLIPGVPRTGTLIGKLGTWAWRVGAGQIKPEDIPGDIIDGLYDAFFPGANAINQITKATGVADKKVKPSQIWD